MEAELSYCPAKHFLKAKATGRALSVSFPSWPLLPRLQQLLLLLVVVLLHEGEHMAKRVASGSGRQCWRHRDSAREAQQEKEHAFVGTEAEG